MKIFGKSVRIAAALGCAIAICLGSVFGVYATNAEEENTLTIMYDHDGAVFSLYRAGEFTEKNTFILSGDFADLSYSVDLNIYDPSGWNAVADTLLNEVKSKNIVPFKRETTAGGKAVFEGLPRGLYLVGECVYDSGSKIYTAPPFMVCLPSYDENYNIINDLSVSPKNIEEEDKPGGGGSAQSSKRLEVVWEGDEDISDNVRPGSVRYDLYRDGELYGSVYLGPESGNAEGFDWGYVWESLEDGHEWSIEQEGLPDGYKSVVSVEDDTFVIVNVYSRPQTPEEPYRTPSGGGRGDSYDVGIDDSTPITDDPTGEHYPAEPLSPEEKAPEESEPYIPGESIIPGAPEPVNGTVVPDEVVTGEGAEAEETSEMLPQTGQLWWPVPFFAGAGMILFLFGYIRRGDGRDEEN